MGESQTDEECTAWKPNLEAKDVTFLFPTTNIIANTQRYNSLYCHLEAITVEASVSMVVEVLDKWKFSFPHVFKFYQYTLIC